jgi:hypothetical protein
MKKILFILSLTTILFISCKKEKNIIATVIKDCSGYYLQVEEKYYLVCNREILKDYNDGQEVVLSFNKINSCNNNYISCMMFSHKNESWVEIKKINK